MNRFTNSIQVREFSNEFLNVLVRNDIFYCAVSFEMFLVEYSIRCLMSIYTANECKTTTNPLLFFEN